MAGAFEKASEIGTSGASRDLEVAAIAAREDGVISRPRLLALGISRFSIRRRLEKGWLHELWPGVYAVGHERVSARGKARAAVFACGPDALLSHRSAAWMWGLLSDDRAIFDVTAPGKRRRQRSGIRLHQPRILHDEDRAEVESLPVTSVARTLLDLAATATHRRLTRALEEALRQRTFDLTALQRLLERNRGRRGHERLTTLIARSTDSAPDTRTELEQRFVELCEGRGLRGPAANVTLAGHCVDAHWPGTRLVVELDSWSFHRTRQAFENDRRRDADLKLAGFEVLPVTWRWLTTDPVAVAAAVRGLLG